MLEPDHVLLRSVPLVNVSLGNPLAFFFSCAPAREHRASSVIRNEVHTHPIATAKTPDEASRRPAHRGNK